MIPVLIDCDPGQDDALALLLALASPELEVLGVTTVAGNQTVDKTTANALRLRRIKQAALSLEQRTRFCFNNADILST